METAAIIEPCKSRKRRRRHFGFQSFGTTTMDHLKGPFRENIRLFLREFGEYETYTISGMPVWSTLFVSESNDAVFPLYIIEETADSSPHPYCTHCKFVGWGHHFVSKRRYHIIIRADYDNLNKPLKGNCMWHRTHLLHGLIHCNGYGHLITLNKLNEDSTSFSGGDVMDLWDRICTTLKTRKISVDDFSRKKSVELRLLYGVTHGTSWFGKWGYKFGHGSFGVNEDKYDRAIKLFSTLSLDKIIDDFKGTVQGRKIEQIVRGYRGVSESSLVTISDLLQFILAFKSRPPIQRKLQSLPLIKLASSGKTPQKDAQQISKPMSLSSFVSSLANSDCRWHAKRLETTVLVIVRVLNENKASVDSKGAAMSRHEIREGARNCIGDTGLIDYVLKSISCVAVGEQIVSRSTNPSTRVYEFTIDDIVKEVEPARKPKAFVSSLAKLDCRWPRQRLAHVGQVIVDILKAKEALGNGSGTMSRQELRDGARQCVGDTGLIDFVLKSIKNNSLIGNHRVSRSKNPSTRLIEFAICDENVVELPGLVAHVPGQDVYQDVLFLYNNVLLGYPEWDSVSLATRAILDSKQFVKEWAFKEEEMGHQLMTLTCRVLPSFDELETKLTRPLCPGEVVMVPPDMTIGELKGVAQCALRDTYLVMDEFVVTQIGGLKAIEEEKVLSCAVESGAQVWVRGTGLDLDTELRYEDGPEDERVDCVCGAKDDDGERMVACDECHVWQHTRCRGIDDDEPSPSIFLCYKCVVQG